MAEEEVPEQPIEQGPSTKPGISTRVVIALVVVAVFAGVLAAKFLTPPEPAGNGTSAVADSITSVRNDASADYEAALKTGEPIYVLFHSLS